MVRRIEKDNTRFKQIVRGRIKKELRKYITRGELIGRKGKNLVSIPLPQIDIPRFRYGQKQTGGVGQGDGDIGTPIAGDPKQPGAGNGAGEQPGEHILEVDVELSELAKILGEELELPRIEPRGKKSISSAKERYTGIHRAGPESLRHFKRTYKEALKRQIATGAYDPAEPVIIPIREDKRYRSWKVIHQPESNAVIIYMMDVSGSMGYEQKEIVRIESFWIDTWLRSQYRNIESRYIVHDATAKEVDQHTFFHIRESGGTKISSAYELAERLIDERFPPEEWNIYLFHFSDGDNWGGDDTRKCIQLLEQSLVPKANLFCYGQVKSAYGSGQFIKDLRGHFKEHESVILSEIGSRDEIYDSIKAFLGKGR
jgi:sporulation protein YhbH